MTAITLANDLPSELNTLEKLTYHNILAMNQLFSNQEYQLDEQNKQFKKVQVNIGRALDGRLYAVCTLSFDLDAVIVEVNPTNRKPWMAAMDWGQTAYPPAFRQNSPT